MTRWDTLCPISTTQAYIVEYEPAELNILVDHPLQVGHLIGRGPVQENVEGDCRSLILNLVDQRRETDGVINLESWSIG